MNKHLAIIISTLQLGGAERASINIANELANRGHKVDILTLSANGPLRSLLDTEVNIIDLKSARLRSSLLPIIRYLRQKSPHAVLVSMWPLTIITSLASLLTRNHVRTILVEHCTWSKSELYNDRLMRLVIKFTMHLLYPRANAIVAVSEGAADDLAEVANIRRKSITTIYNPIVGREDLTANIEQCAPQWWNGSHKRLLAVGTLKEIKDYTNLIRAVAIVKKHIDVKLLILGEGACRTNLELETRRLGLEEVVFMPGALLDPTPYFRHADLHVLSSLSEGFANVIVEAMAAGTPVVSTDCPWGPREILADGRYGTLVTVADTSALAAGIINSLSRPHDKSRLRRRAQDFTIAKSVDRYEALLLSKDEDMSGGS
jgi:glycosyltransferase involved in cell wall biosynthesis